MAGEGLPLGRAERWRTAADGATRAHRVHEVADRQQAADGIGGVALAARTDRGRALVDDGRRERQIARDHEIAIAHALDDSAVSDIEAGGDDEHPHRRHPGQGERLIGDEGHGDAGALGRTHEHVAQHPRTGIRIDPDRRGHDRSPLERPL